VIVEDAPAPPDSRRWIDVLHWIARVLPSEHPDLGFTASLLAQAIRLEGLTERQATYARKIHRRTLLEWRAQSEARLFGSRTTDLRQVEPRGRA
jgi:hypothetical protein